MKKGQSKKKENKLKYFLLDFYEKDFYEFSSKQELETQIMQWLNDGDIDMVSEHFRKKDYQVFKGEKISVNIDNPKKLIIIKENK